MSKTKTAISAMIFVVLCGCRSRDIYLQDASTWLLYGPLPSGRGEIEVVEIGYHRYFFVSELTEKDVNRIHRLKQIRLSFQLDAVTLPEAILQLNHQLEQNKINDLHVELWGFDSVEELRASFSPTYRYDQKKLKQLVQRRDKDRLDRITQQFNNVSADEILRRLIYHVAEFWGDNCHFSMEENTIILRWCTYSPRESRD